MKKFLGTYCLVLVLVASVLILSACATMTEDNSLPADRLQEGQGSETTIVEGFASSGYVCTYKRIGSQNVFFYKCVDQQEKITCYVFREIGQDIEVQCFNRGQ